MVASLVASGCAVVEDPGTDGSEGDEDGEIRGDGDGDEGSGGTLGSGGTVTMLGSGGADSGGANSGGSPSGAGGDTTESGGSSSGGASSTGGSGSSGSGSGGSAAGGSGSGGSGSGGSGSGGAPPSGCEPVESGEPDEVLFAEDFETGADGWTTTAGTWAVVTDGTSVYEQSQEANAIQLATADDTCFGDQVVTARVKVLDFPGQSTSYVAALYARVASAQTHYLLAIGSDGKLVIRKRVGSSSTSATKVGSDVDLNLVEGTWYTLRFELIGNTLSAYVNDSLEITATDSSISAGAVGFGTTQAHAVFDDLVVTAP